MGMRAAIAVVSTDPRDDARGDPIDVRDRAAVYRDPEADDEVVVEADGERIPLGVEDVTVSRRREGDPAVAVEAASNHVRVHNCGHPKGAVVETATGEEERLDPGESAVLVDDATVRLGYATELSLSVRAV